MIVTDKMLKLVVLAGTVMFASALDANTCQSTPNRPIIKRPAPPTKAPTLAPQAKATSAPVLVAGGEQVSCVKDGTSCVQGMAPCCNFTSACIQNPILPVGNFACLPKTMATACVNDKFMCRPGVDVCCQPTSYCKPSLTNSSIGTCMFCGCGDKSESIEGDGKVTGGGWIYLTNKTYLNPALVCGTSAACEAHPYKNVLAGTVLSGRKANYGFNAMWRKGYAHGSTNFDFDGASFHFHSDTQNKPYRYLEVVDEVHARWWGKGKLAAKLAPKKNDWQNDYCFMVAVQDHGEPGADDTWRIRIWKCMACYTAATLPSKDPLIGSDPMTWNATVWNSCSDKQEVLVFDTNYVPFWQPGTGMPHEGLTAPANNLIRSPDGWNHTGYTAVFPLPSRMAANDPQKWRFNGTTVGDWTKNGGGNIQIHLKGKTNKFLDYIKAANGTCGCNETINQEYDQGFVTGGGWIYLDEQAFMKIPNCGCHSGSTTAKYDAAFDDSSCQVAGLEMTKASYGFNAKYIKGVPQGSFNFVILGNGFHFRSDKMSLVTNQEYDQLEVVCDNKYGPGGNGVFARWTGIGKLARTIGNTATESIPATGWVGGYRFWVAVQDNGEPGLLDSIRLRIADKDCPSEIYFDTDINAGVIYGNDPFCETTGASVLCDETLPGASAPDFGGTNLMDRFNGTQVGWVDALKGGGGNIQIHCKGGPR